MFVVDTHGRVTLDPASAERDRREAAEAVTVVLQRQRYRRRRHFPVSLERVVEGPAGGVVFFLLLAATLALWFGGR